jgi:arsenate reductase (thioredoxin)
MGEGILKILDPALEVFSAGVAPEKEVNPFAIAAMAELGIDISNNIPKSIEIYTGLDFDYIITVCDNAREACPVFFGSSAPIVHVGFEDPARAKGNHEEIMQVYRTTRDRMMIELKEFYESNLKNLL